MKLSARARNDLAAFRRHYKAKGRPEAVRNVSSAMDVADFRIGAGFSVPAPTPYPELRQEGRAWVRAGHYWIFHTTTEPITALAVFHDTADIPNRF